MDKRLPRRVRHRCPLSSLVASEYSAEQSIAAAVARFVSGAATAIFHRDAGEHFLDVGATTDPACFAAC